MVGKEEDKKPVPRIDTGYIIISECDNHTTEIILR